MFAGLSTVKLIALAVAAASILAFVTLAFHWKGEMTKRGQKLEIICKATRTAADNPKMDCDNTVVQIQEIGASLKSTTDALNKQNKAVADLGKQNAAEQQAAAESEKAAQKRAVHADSTSARLKASSVSPAVLAKPCEPSKELAGAWK